MRTFDRNQINFTQSILSSENLHDQIEDQEAINQTEMRLQNYNQTLIRKIQSN